jgi:hypothetical protein
MSRPIIADCESITLTDPEHVTHDQVPIGLRVRDFRIQRVTPRIIGPEWFDLEITVTFQVTDTQRAWSFLEYFIDHAKIGITAQGQTFEGYATVGHWGFLGPGQRPTVELSMEVTQASRSSRGSTA